MSQPTTITQKTWLVFTVYPHIWAEHIHIWSKNRMMQTNQMPGFCVIYSMHLISWLLFEKVNEQNLTQESSQSQYQNYRPSKIDWYWFKNSNKVEISVKGSIAIFFFFFNLLVLLFGTLIHVTTHGETRVLNSGGNNIFLFHLKWRGTLLKSKNISKIVIPWLYWKFLSNSYFLKNV